MPSLRSTLAAGRATVLRRVSAMRSLSPRAALVLLAGLALAVGVVTSTQGARTVARAHGGPAGRAGPAALARSPGTAPATLYRLVGCRSRGRGVYRHGPPRRQVAIGFDDGPAADTGAFVAMLERARVKATFFMIGRQVTARYRATLLRELRDGDPLGDHSFTHSNLVASGGVRGQLGRTIAAIRSVTGYTPCVFRPPYGAVDASIARTARSLGLATIGWNVDPFDWARPGSGAIRRRVLAQVQPGSIILSHDGGGPRGETLAAYPAIIASLRARGYKIVTIPELLGFRPVYAPCSLPCAHIAIPRGRLLRDAIIEPGR